MTVLVARGVLRVAVVAGENLLDLGRRTLLGGVNARDMRA